MLLLLQYLYRVNVIWVFFRRRTVILMENYVYGKLQALQFSTVILELDYIKEIT